MNIKSRLERLEKFNSKGLEVIIPTVKFIGGETEADCTHAIAYWGDGHSFQVERGPKENSSEFSQRFVEEYMAEIQEQLSDKNTRVAVLEHDADLL
ncbi:hypothetical protein [uncultured Roseovarius sp.]|uniref:hypothetical protein n=1 Tax=uncultured Roseovarius sp. TaxID=293344 RepID=UPI002638E002|nr:hypothetical protein [uncultured Roseovarius sp.]